MNSDRRKKNGVTPHSSIPFARRPLPSIEQTDRASDVCEIQLVSAVIAFHATDLIYDFDDWTKASPEVLNAH